ncbi:hypothetical protein B7463_g3593, partial [Scytalidium lignicola]
MNKFFTKDIELANMPEDSISALSWSPQANHLAVSSWDSKVYIYDTNAAKSGIRKAFITFDGPVLDCHWSKDGSVVIGAGADRTARILDLGSGGSQAYQVALHDKPIRSVRFIQIPQSNATMAVTGSWDKTVKYWDLRQATPAGTIHCKERVYAMDVKNNLLVIGTADHTMNIVKLDDPMTIQKSMESPFKHQMKAIACCPNAKGFGIVGLEGRCALRYVNEEDEKNNFSFRCHREAAGNKLTRIYTVNAISFHPVYGTFSTAGSDGTFHFWDGVGHHRLKGFSTIGSAISATGFNRDGSLFAYAVSYDWSKGASGNNPDYPNRILLHKVDDDEVNPGVARKL